MTAEQLAALIWRFVGMILFLSPLFAFTHHIFSGNSGEPFILSLFLVPIGACLMIFSKRLGSLMAKGL